jgi:glutathione synthase/RimK-type ligase-like ATP-grasp enzyme
VNKTLYWITAEKFEAGHPHEAALYRVLAERGYRVVHHVWDRDPLPALRENEAIIIRTPWDYPGKMPAFETWLAALPDARVFNPREILLWNADKTYLQELEAAGVPIVPTHWLHAKADSEVEAALLASFPGREKVIKPVKSAGAFHTYRFTDSALPPVSPFAGRPAMIQPFVSEMLQEGERSLVYFGGRFSHALAKRPKAGDFRVQEEFGGRFEAFQPEDAEIEFADRILRAVDRKFVAQLVGKPLLYARVDYVRIGGQPHLMELELLEPDLYIHQAPGSAERFEIALRAALV